MSYSLFAAVPETNWNIHVGKQGYVFMCLRGDVVMFRRS